VQRTQHELHLDGQVVKYTATVGWLILKRDEFGKKDDKKAEKDGKGPRGTADRAIRLHRLHAGRRQGRPRRPVTSPSMAARLFVDLAAHGRARAEARRRQRRRLRAAAAGTARRQ
jgi:hypothetical protein